MLAPLTADGDLVYEIDGAAPSSLRLGVLGWVSGSPAADGVAADRGLTALAAPAAARVTSAGSLSVVDLRDADLPASADVVLRADVRTGRTSGSVSASGTVLGILLPSVAVLLDLAASAPVPADAETSTTLVSEVGPAGLVYLRAPVGARITSVAVLGHTTGPVEARADRVAPVLTVTSPTDGAVLDQADSPEVTFTGTASDEGSGIREVSLTVGSEVIASAPGPLPGGTWTITTPVPVGTHEVTATALDWAGRSTSVARTLTVEAPAEDDVVVSPDVTVLDEAALDSLVAVEEDVVVLTGGTDLRAGDVIVSATSELTPDGLLRRVEAVERVGGTSVVHTGPAVLTDAILQADLEATDIELTEDSVEIPFGSASARVVAPPLRLDGETGTMATARVAPASWTGGIGHTLSWKLSRDIAIAGDPKAAKLEFSSSASIRIDVTLDVRMDIGWDGISTEVTEFSVIRKDSTSTEATMSLLAPISKQEKKFPLGEKHLGTVTLWAGPVPVVIGSKIGAGTYVTLATTAKITVSLKHSQTAKKGVEYRDGVWAEVDEETSDFEAGANVSVTGSAGAGLSLTLELTLYELVGPQITGSAGLEYSLGVTSAVLPKPTLTVKETLDLVLKLALKVQGELLGRELFGFDPAEVTSRTTLRSNSWTEEVVSPEDPEDPTDPEDPADPEDPTDPTDPGDEEPHPGDGQGSGFGLANVTLDVCRPDFVDTEQTLTAVDAGSPDEGRTRTYRMGPGFMAAMEQTDTRRAWATVVIAVPGLDPSTPLRVEWEHDPTTDFAQMYPGIYSERA